MQRRSLLGAMLAACAAPAYVKAGILMPVKAIVVPPQDVWAWTTVEQPQWLSYDFGAGNDHFALFELDHATGMLTLRESSLA